MKLNFTHEEKQEKGFWGTKTIFVMKAKVILNDEETNIRNSLSSAEKNYIIIERESGGFKMLIGDSDFRDATVLNLLDFGISYEYNLEDERSFLIGHIKKIFKGIKRNYLETSIEI